MIRRRSLALPRMSKRLRLAARDAAASARGASGRCVLLRDAIAARAAVASPCGDNHVSLTCAQCASPCWCKYLKSHRPPGNASVAVKAYTRRVHVGAFMFLTHKLLD